MPPDFSSHLSASITAVRPRLVRWHSDGIDGQQVLNLERLGRTIGLDCD